MEYTKKLIYQSNSWYNDGLAKAKIRDLSGAMTSLKKSLQFNRENIAARNLLGLVYYARGEVAEALVEWIISKNLKSHENLANYYVKKVQETPSELEAMNMAIKKYNQCLNYCDQGGEDLALIQLKKIVLSHPTFLKAQQLLALLYLQTEQYPKARQVLRKARKLDTTNDITLRYLHVLSKVNSKKLAKIKEDKEQTVTYNLGNETIIQPAAAAIKDNGPLATIVNILIGIAVGAAVVWFLVMPTVSEVQSGRLNAEVVKYSDQIAAKNAEVSALKKEMEGYKETTEAAEEAQAVAAGTKSSYEALLSVYEHSRDQSYDEEKLAQEIKAVKKEPLGTQAAALYDEIYESAVTKLCEEKYKAGLKSYEAGNYKKAVTALELVVSLEEGYEDGKALLALADAYEKEGQTDKAKTSYEKVVELYPDTEIAKEAGKKLLKEPAEE